jgi:hypothetical protein
MTCSAAQSRWDRRTLTVDAAQGAEQIPLIVRLAGRIRQVAIDYAQGLIDPVKLPTDSTQTHSDYE